MGTSQNSKFLFFFHHHVQDPTMKQPVDFCQNKTSQKLKNADFVFLPQALPRPLWAWKSTYKKTNITSESLGVTSSKFDQALSIWLSQNGGRTLGPAEGVTKKISNMAQK